MSVWLNSNPNTSMLTVLHITDSEMPVDGQSLIRSAKSGRNWAENELLAYKIQVSSQEAPQFFGRELCPIDHLDAKLLSTIDPSIASNLSKETYRFLALLDLASHADVGQESAINDFRKAVLEVTGYDELGTILRSRYDIPFTIAGETRTAKTGLCLVHFSSMILLVVQEDKADGTSMQSPEAQVIAEAIATFETNNRKRRNRHLERLESMNVPCITMIGTRPRFYKVPVTRELSKAVICGQYPKQSTIVTCCAPPPRLWSFEAMEVPDYRRIALQYYDAFRGFAKECWTAFIAGV